MSVATKKEMAQRLGDVELFSRCTKRDLRIVARHLETTSVVAGHKVVNEGDHGETFFLLLSGELAVSANEEQTAVLGVGAHFGELALLHPAPRSATVTALTDCELGVLGVRMFRVILRDMPHIAGELLAVLAEQLRDARSVGSA